MRFQIERSSLGLADSKESPHPKATKGAPAPDSGRFYINTGNPIRDHNGLWFIELPDWEAVAKLAKEENEKVIIKPPVENPAGYEYREPGLWGLEIYDGWRE